MILLLAASLLAVPAISTIWLRTTFRSTDAVADLVTPVHRDSDLADTVAGHLAEWLTRNDRVDDSVTTSELQREIRSLIMSPSSEGSWRRSVERAHRDSLKTIDSSRDETTYLDLSFLRRDLEDAFPQLDVKSSNEYSVTVLDEDNVGRVRDSQGLITTLAWLLPLLTVLSLAGGMFAARTRLRGLAVFGVAVSVIAAISIVVTFTVPGAITSAVTSADARSAARTVVDGATSNLVKVLVLVLVLGLATTATGFLLERRQRNLQPPPMAWPGA